MKKGFNKHFYEHYLAPFQFLRNPISFCSPVRLCQDFHSIFAVLGEKCDECGAGLHDHGCRDQEQGGACCSQPSRIRRSLYNSPHFVCTLVPEPGTYDRQVIFLNFSFIYQNPKVTARGVTKEMQFFYLGWPLRPPYKSDKLEKKRRNCWGTEGYHWLCATVRMEPNKQTILLCIFHLGLQLTKFVYCSFLCTGNLYPLETMAFGSYFHICLQCCGSGSGRIGVNSDGSESYPFFFFKESYPFLPNCTFPEIQLTYPTVQNTENYDTYDAERKIKQSNLDKS